ncbi:hypothetical protein SDC9_183811 [bioreactor metagenome]|uniref:Uncharacterized protein n=1 Tax=bioreactor metagenome TaxID=1076179 RepID=A0A645HD60_9ZZZZ
MRGARLESPAQPQPGGGGEHTVPFPEPNSRMLFLVAQVSGVTFAAARGETALVERVEDDEADAAAFEVVEEILQPEQRLELLFGMEHEVVIARHMPERMAAPGAVLQQERNFIVFHAVAEIAQVDCEIEFDSVEDADQFPVPREHTGVVAPAQRRALGILRVADQGEASQGRLLFITVHSERSLSAGIFMEISDTVKPVVGTRLVRWPHGL